VRVAADDTGRGGRLLGRRNRSRSETGRDGGGESERGEASDGFGTHVSHLHCRFDYE
jgi:hypothetical protein